MRITTNRDLAFICARVDAMLRGAAATAAQYELTKDLFLQLAGRAYGDSVSLFAEADARDRARAGTSSSSSRMSSSSMLKTGSASAGAAGLYWSKRRWKAVSTSPSSGIELIEGAVYELTKGDVLIEKLDGGDGLINFVWLSGTYSHLDELREDFSVRDFFRGAELVDATLRDYQNANHPQILVGQVWKVSHPDKLMAELDNGPARIVITQVGDDRIRFRWIEGGFADTADRDDSSNLAFLYSHARLEHNRPEAVSGSVWTDAGPGREGRTYILTERYEESPDGGTGWRYVTADPEDELPITQWIRDEYLTGNFSDSKIFTDAPIAQHAVTFLGFVNDRARPRRAWR